MATSLARTRLSPALFANGNHVPRFSLRLLFLLTIITAATVAYLTRPSPQERIQLVLSSSMSDAEKLRHISKYFKLGDQETSVHEQIGQPCGLSGGVVQHDCFYGECNLILSYRWDGTLFEIGYHDYSNGSMSPDFRLLDAWPLDPKESK